jgi:hypothetical protein
MNLKAISFLFLCSTAFAEDRIAADRDERTERSTGIHVALIALAKADSIKVTGELKRMGEKGVITVPISKEIRSRESIAKLSSLLATHRWAFLFRDNYTVDDDASFLRMISFEKGRKADEFKLIGKHLLEQPWMGIFRNDSESLNAKLFNLILKAE